MYENIIFYYFLHDIFLALWLSRNDPQRRVIHMQSSVLAGAYVAKAEHAMRVAQQRSRPLFIIICQL